MVLNTGLDLVVGAVPLLGDLFDVGFKANVKNLRLLERHAHPGVRPSGSDYAFVWGAIALVVALAVVPVLLFVWLLARVTAV